ncbi:MAG: ankyrin repeat domain-containing protein [Rhodospirillales bacterium]
MITAPHASRNGGAASRPQSAPLFVVEGRIGGRWWVWQRFRLRDEAAHELAALASEKRFDGVRLIVTILGDPGTPATSRELVVVDEEGVHGPDGPVREPAQPARYTVSARARPAPPPAPSTPKRRRVEPHVPPAPLAPYGVDRRAPLAAPVLAQEVEPTEDGPPPEPEGDFRIAPMVANSNRDDGFADPGPAYLPTRQAARLKRRQVVYTLGAGVASLMLAVVSYEITRSIVGLPDLLYEARQSASALFAGPERPIVVAARQGNTEEVAKLLRGGFSPNSEDAYGVPALLIAARAGKASVVRQLLEAGADPNRPFRRGDTPLLAAAREGLNNAIEPMLAKGGHVNGRGGTDLCETPLLVAAGGGRMDTVNFLLGKGASFDVLPGCRKGPLDAAAAYPRVREALEQAYQRRLAAVSRPGQAGSPAAIPAAAAAPAAPVQAAPPAPAAPQRPAAAPVERPALRTPSAAVPAPSGAPAQAKSRPVSATAETADPAAMNAAYRSIMFGFDWSASLDQVRAKSKSCRNVGKRYLACELTVKRWLDDIESVEAWFDRSDGERLVAFEALSGPIMDTSTALDGSAARQQFDKVRAAIEKKLPPGLRPIVARQAPAGIPFFAGLKPEVNAGDYSVFWSDDGRRRPAAIHLKLTGVDDQSGQYRIVVSNPQRYSQQALIAPPKK